MTTCMLDTRKNNQLSRTVESAERPSSPGSCPRSPCTCCGRRNHIVKPKCELPTTRQLPQLSAYVKLRSYGPVMLNSAKLH